jgi:hypothetical protein
MNAPYFRLGAIGMILIAIMAPIHFAIYFFGWMYILPTGPFAPYFLLLLITAIVLYVGFILAGIGFFGYYRVYNLTWGIVGFLIPILFGWALIIVEVDYFIAFWTSLPFIPPLFYPIIISNELVFWVLKDTVLAFTPILWSITVFQVASHTDNKRRTQIAGVLLLASGIAYLPQIYLDLVGGTLIPYVIVISTGTALLCLAALVNSLVFFSEKSPKLSA